MMYFDYFIGGSFDDIVVDWKWVNGSIIDPNYLTNYPVSGGPGACLIWSDIHYLYDYPCSVTIPAICDIPMTTSSGEIRTVILGLLIKTKATMMITCIFYRIKTIINSTLCLKDIIQFDSMALRASYRNICPEVTRKFCNIMSREGTWEQKS